MKQKPVIFLAFANERGEEEQYLRNLPKELAGIRDIFSHLEVNEEVEIITLSNATLYQIVDILQDKRYRDRIAVFHYGGHANSYGFLFENIEGTTNNISGKNFLKILARPSLKLVFLNGCATQTHAINLNDAGIPLVIATSQAVADEVATQVAIRFYKGFVQGIHLEKAWSDAKETVKSFYESNQERSGRRPSFLDGNDSLSPWALYVRKGSEEMRFWDLSQAIQNPLFGLPEIPQDYYLNLPPSPYLSLRHFEKKHAAIFFGRGTEIRDLHKKIQSIYPIVLYYGQSGVGKSSLLDAGLLPRLEHEYTPIYLRRDRKIGLLNTFANGISPDSSEDRIDSQAIFDQWFAIEQEVQKPLIVILDQVEEAFTRPLLNTNPDTELKDLFQVLSDGFNSTKEKPQGKIILAYRKEYHPEIKSHLNHFGIPSTELFLRPMSRSGIIEAIEGVAKHNWLKDKYGLKIEEESNGRLPDIIADDLLEDQKSTIAPILQIWLTEMWDEEIKKNPGSPQFTITSYQKLKQKGLLLSNFLEEKFQEIRRWNTEIVDSGLLLDFMYFLTTPHNTAEQRTIEVLKDRYSHLSIDLEELIEEIKKTYLVIENTDSAGVPTLRLAHDILAPTIRKEYEESSKLGQIAAKILRNKVQEITLTKEDSGLKQKEIILDGQSLDIVEKGRLGMRRRTDSEKDLIDKSVAAKARRIRSRRLNRRIISGSAIALIILGVLSWTFFIQSSKDQKWAESNYLASLALDELQSNPTESFKKARLAWKSSPGNNLAYRALMESSYEQVYKYDEGVYATPFYEDVFKREDWPYSVKYSNDGEYYAVGATNGFVYVFQSDGTSIDSIQIKKSPGEVRIREVVFSPSDKSILAAAENSLFVLNFIDNKLTINYSKNISAPIRSFDLVPNAEENRAAFTCEGKIIFWDWQEGRFVDSISILEEDNLRDVSISNDGKFIATGGKGEIIWILNANGQFVDSIHCDGEINSLSFNPEYSQIDSNQLWLIAGITNGKILGVYNLKKEKYKEFSGHKGWVNSVSFFDNGKYIASTSFDRKVKLWDVDLDSAILTLSGHRQSVYNIDFSKNNESLLTSSLDGTLKRWRLKDRPIPNVIIHPNTIRSLDLSKDGNFLVSAYKDGWVFVSSLRNQEIDSIKLEGRLVKAMFAFNDSKILIANGKYISIWDFTAEPQTLESIQVCEDFCIMNSKGISLSYDEKSLAIAFDKQIQLRDVDKLEDLKFILEGHEKTINSIRFSPSDNELISTSYDQRVIIWDLLNESKKISIDLGSVGMDAFFRSYEDKYIVGTSDAEILISSLNQEKSSNVRLFQHTESVKSLCPGSQRPFFASTSFDGTLGIWGNDGELIVKLRNHNREAPTTVLFSNDEKYAFSGFSNGEILVWPIESDILIEGKY
jgi:WD40 repeat protein